MENNSDNIKQRIIELLGKMGFDAEVYERMEEGRTVLNIKTRDAQLLIGKQGSTLEALQHIIRSMIRRQGAADTFSFALDVDDYKDKRTLYLKDLARKAAHQVRETKRPVSLVPMPPYERRVVHNYLSLYNDISSQSTGTEPGRKIVIRPKTAAKSKDDFNFIENL